MSVLQLRPNFSAVPKPRCCFTKVMEGSLLGSDGNAKVPHSPCSHSCQGFRLFLSFSVSTALNLQAIKCFLHNQPKDMQAWLQIQPDRLLLLRTASYILSQRQYLLGEVSASGVHRRSPAALVQFECHSDGFLLFASFKVCQVLFFSLSATPFATGNLHCLKTSLQSKVQQFLQQFLT